VAGILAATVPIHTDRTLYVLVGDAFGWICLCLAGMLAAVRAGGRAGDRVS
jgi:apolipoprotein N-acyltransferase